MYGPRAHPQLASARSELGKVLPRDIELFTTISGDRNPLHHDEELAKATKFDGIVVQVGLQARFLNAVVARIFRVPGPYSYMWTGTSKRPCDRETRSRA